MSSLSKKSSGGECPLGICGSFFVPTFPIDYVIYSFLSNLIFVFYKLCFNYYKNLHNIISYLITLHDFRINDLKLIWISWVIQLQIELRLLGWDEGTSLVEIMLNVAKFCLMLLVYGIECFGESSGLYKVVQLHLENLAEKNIFLFHF